MNTIKTMLMAVMVFTFHLSPFTLPAQTQQLPLSETATASVITCGAGNEFYHSFCHSALRIQDTARGIDFVYNYGTFDFDTPHFYWKFARGRLNYCLSRSTFQHFIAAYDYERRAVWEQPLNFTPQEVANLFYALEWNYLPENRYYRYDFFRDNCATRVRDMVEAANGKCKIEYGRDWKDHSYRYWLHQATAGGRLEWWMLGVDLLLGLSADHVCDISESMFYPMAMMWLTARRPHHRVAPRPPSSAQTKLPTVGRFRAPLCCRGPADMEKTLAPLGRPTVVYHRRTPRSCTAVHVVWNEPLLHGVESQHSVGITIADTHCYTSGTQSEMGVVGTGRMLRCGGGMGALVWADSGATAADTHAGATRWRFA